MQKPSLEFSETSIFLYSPRERILRNDLFLKKQNNNHLHVQWRTDQQHLRVQFKTNLSEVQFKFLGNKKGPMEGFFYLESVFLYRVFLLNCQNCFYISEGLYLSLLHATV